MDKTDQKLVSNDMFFGLAYEQESVEDKDEQKIGPKCVEWIVPFIEPTLSQPTTGCTNPFNESEF